MRKLAIIWLFVVLLLSALNHIPSVNAEVSYKEGSFDFYIKGLKVTHKTPAINSDGVAMIPARLIAIEAGVEIRYENDRYCFYNDENVCVMKVTSGYKTVTVGNEKVQFQRAIVIEEGILYVPAIETSNILKLTVKYDDLTGYTTLTRTKKVESWADEFLKTIDPKTLIYACFGAVIFFMVLFFILVPVIRYKSAK
jgi:hypothetical protein